jgi:hypothetical protein
MAVSIVEDWLAEITTCPDCPVSVAAVDGAAAGLCEAVVAGECPLTCVVAGFETALLQCAAPRGLACDVDARPGLGTAAAAAAESPAQGAVEEIAFSRVWCRAEALRCGVLTSLLRAAVRLDAMLLERTPQQAPPCDSLLGILGQHLHAAAVYPQRLQAALSTEACVLAAAAAMLYRAQGNVQVRQIEAAGREQ